MSDNITAEEYLAGKKESYKEGYVDVFKNACERITSLTDSLSNCFESILLEREMEGKNE